jgi:hypothetical protein
MSNQAFREWLCYGMHAVLFRGVPEKAFLKNIWLNYPADRIPDIFYIRFGLSFEIIY